MDGVVLNTTTEELEEEGIIPVSPEEKEKKSEERYIAQKRKMESVYIPPEEMEKLREAYSHSVVQDFDDMYHMSKENRIKMQEQHGKFLVLAKMKKKVRRIDQYVTIHRLCLDILNDIAETNGVYSPEKFKKLVLQGKIKVNGLVFPKLLGKLRKTINWDYVVDEYIVNRDKDPKELLMEDEPEELEDSSLESLVERYFGHEKMEEIFENYEREKEKESERTIFDFESDKYVAEYGDKKSKKKLVRMSPVILDVIKKQDRLNRRRNRAKALLTELQDEDLELIRKYDLKRSKSKMGYGIPEFTGDATNDDDIKEYEEMIDAYERENTFIEYHGRIIKLEDAEEMGVRELMDMNNWNLRNLYYNKEEEKRLKKARKRDKKKEKRLKDMLLEIQKRKQGRNEKIQGINTKEKRYKKKKKSKKKHKKTIRKFDDVLLDVTGNAKKTFDEYRKEMETFSWMK